MKYILKVEGGFCVHIFRYFTCLYDAYWSFLSTLYKNVKEKNDTEKCLLYMKNYI